jgi:hypothetical protein
LHPVYKRFVYLSRFCSSPLVGVKLVTKHDHSYGVQIMKKKGIFC